MKNKDKAQTALDQESVDELLAFVTYKLYELLGELNDGLAERLDPRQVNDIMVHAMAINLGHVIGQLDASSQRKYAALAKQMIKEHTLLGAMEKERHIHGMIGRA